MTTAKYVRRLRRAGQPLAAGDAGGSLAAPGESTRPMRAHAAFAHLLDEAGGAAAHTRGVMLDRTLETPRCLLTPLV